MNDLSTDANERVGEVYGSTKLERLVVLKARWDPKNTLHLNANISPPPVLSLPIPACDNGRQGAGVRDSSDREWQLGGST